jgi:hypothetical protein
VDYFDLSFHSYVEEVRFPLGVCSPGGSGGANRFCNVF